MEQLNWPFQGAECHHVDRRGWNLNATRWSRSRALVFLLKFAGERRWQDRCFLVFKSPKAQSCSLCAESLCVWSKWTYIILYIYTHYICIYIYRAATLFVWKVHLHTFPHVVWFSNIVTQAISEVEAWKKQAGTWCNVWNSRLPRS